MIPRRHTWLLRSADTLYEQIPAGAWGWNRCKLCAVLERPAQVIPRADQARHLAAHRREKIDRRPDSAVELVMAATETEE